MYEMTLKSMARIAAHFHHECEDAHLTKQDRMALITHIALCTLMTQFREDEEDQIVTEFKDALSKSLADYRKTSEENHRLWFAAS